MKIEVEIPVSEETLDTEAKERLRRDLPGAAVLRLCDERRITSVEAREQPGLTRIAFMELTRQRGIPMYDYTFADWDEDKKVLERLRPEIEKNVMDLSAGRLR